MKIVIDIPREQYSLIMQSHRSGVTCFIDKEAMMYAVKNGTPLPKGHGDLIDKNKLITKAEIWDFKANGIPNYAWRCIKDAPVIIKADKEGEES